MGVLVDINIAIFPFICYHLPMTIAELTDALAAYPPDARITLLYVRGGNQIWQYEVVNIQEDLVGVSLIIESARKLTERPVKP